MKKLSALILAGCMILSLTACGSAVSSSAATASAVEGAKSYRIGIIQLAEHEALDAACKGFQEALSAKGIDVTFDVQNAQGEQSNCATIANKFVNDKVDLILAIATQSAQAAAQATTTIPVLVTAVTDPAAAGIVESNEAPGRNVSGTSDLSPIDQQVALTLKIVPDAKKIGIMYCSSEENSILQAELATAAFEAAGCEVEIMTAADSNEIQSVTSTLCSKVDAIYIPTDNTFAAAMPTVVMVAGPAKIPVICGEGNMVKSGGLASYGLSYLNLGKMTGEQAYEILVNGANIAEMPIGYSTEADLELFINEEMVKTLGITMPADLGK